MKLDYNLINGKEELKYPIIELNTPETYNEEEGIRIAYENTHNYIDYDKLKKFLKENAAWTPAGDYSDADFNTINGLLPQSYMLGDQILVGYDSPGMSLTSAMLTYYMYYEYQGNKHLQVFGYEQLKLTNYFSDGDIWYNTHIILFSKTDGTISVEYLESDKTTTDNYYLLNIETGKIYCFKVNHNKKKIILDEVITPPVKVANSL